MIWYVLGIFAVMNLVMVWACLVVGARHDRRDDDE